MPRQSNKRFTFGGSRPAGGQQASFAGGPIAADATFSLTTSANQTLTGSVAQANVTATFLGQTITATRTPIFGPTEHFSGRFTTTAESDTGASLDVKVVIDSRNISSSSPNREPQCWVASAQ